MIGIRGILEIISSLRNYRTVFISQLFYDNTTILLEARINIA